ncbi:hypothetical protein J6590_058773 [Homalodisca vitripennis]|nr:hypothetical protein J6590_058773 [Homalodisca vitripennis]
MGCVAYNSIGIPMEEWYISSTDQETISSKSAVTIMGWVAYNSIGIPMEECVLTYKLLEQPSPCGSMTHLPPATPPPTTCTGHPTASSP